MADPLRLAAPAKLNLFLHVLGRRADGYHQLQTVFRFLDYGDDVTLAARGDGKVVLDPPTPGVPPDADLCVRAARLLKARAPRDAGVTIRVCKRLPLGGGLGGGSSDAATTLIGLNRLWNLGLARAELQHLGLELGADVPAFVFGQSAFAEGVGERLRAIALEPAWYVVLSPPVRVSTAEIFASPELTRNSNPLTMAAFSMAATRNDLAAVACRKYPAIQRCLDWLTPRGGGRMTGSGACVFGEYLSQAQALDVWRQVPPGWQGFMARGLDRHPLYDF